VTPLARRNATTRPIAHRPTSEILAEYWAEAEALPVYEPSAEETELTLRVTVPIVLIR
jgi:hypothetical protein